LSTLYVYWLGYVNSS